MNRRVELFLEVVSHSRRPRDPGRSAPTRGSRQDVRNIEVASDRNVPTLLHLPVIDLPVISTTHVNSQLDQTIRDALLRSWDPIGVRANPDACDEYDSYIPTIAEMLLADADQYALGRHLTKLEHSLPNLFLIHPKARKCLWRRHDWH